MYITAYRCRVFFTISNVYIQALLSVILTFVPPHHILIFNKHGNVNKSPPINIYFLIAGMENKYFLENRNIVSSWVKQVVSSWVDLPPWVQL